MSAFRKQQLSLARSRREEEKARRERERIHQMNLEATADAERALFEFREQSARPWRRRKLVLALLLIPVCVVASLTFLELFFRATVRGAFWKQEGFWFFSAGCLFWLSLGWLGVRPRLPYVFAHEFTHLITARLSGGKIHDWHVSSEGGYVETDKTSALITLSPYLVPLYTITVVALYQVTALLVNLHEIKEWHLFAWAIQFKWAWIFYVLVGATWCFHLTFTLEILRTEQSDLLHNGEFFSIVVIFLGNLAILGALMVFASPTIGWSDVWRDASGLVSGTWRLFFQG
jgi:hypothetical protein